MSSPLASAFWKRFLLFAPLCFGGVSHSWSHIALQTEVHYLRPLSHADISSLEKKKKKSTLTLFHGCWARTGIMGFFCCLLWLLHVGHHVCLVTGFGLANTHSLSCQLFLMSKCPWCNFCITSFIRIAGIVISLALSSMPSATDNESADGMPITICSALSVHFCCTDKNWLHHHMNMAGNLCFLV